jgi:hypothetical protein
MEKQKEIIEPKEPEEIELPKKESTNKKTLKLELGDIIRVESENNEEYNGKTFYINYIDETKIKLLNIADLTITTILNIENNEILDKSIKSLSLLYRNTKKGYALQHNLLTGTWVTILFEEDVPLLITGEITNIEDDMIEITQQPGGDIIYINFEYKGIPEDLPIKYIQIRPAPKEVKLVKKIPKLLIEPGEEEGEEEEGDEEADVYERELYEPGDESRIRERENPPDNFLQEYLLKADQITFGEHLEEITQFVNVDVSKQRYSIETQTNDLLDNMISKLSVTNKTVHAINSIHIMVERYKQLRHDFSIFDEYGNVESYIQKNAAWKPLVYNLEKYKHMLYWILPVGTNIKKIYDVDYAANVASLLDIEQIMYTYQHTEEDRNKYDTMIQSLNPYFCPFDEPSLSSDKIIDIPVMDNLTVVINNTNNFETTVYENSKLFYMDTYNVGLTKLAPISITGNKYIAERVELTGPDILSLTSILTLPEPVIKFSHINLPGTNLLDKANLNQTFLNYSKLLNKKTAINTISITDLSTNIEFNKANYADTIKNYTLQKNDEMMTKSDMHLYKDYLNIIVPKTRILFKLMDKYITGKLSLYYVVQYLEPFLIYMEDLTFTQYKEMNTYIKQKISDFNKNYILKSREFQSLGIYLNKLQYTIDRNPKSNSNLFDLIIYDTNTTVIKEQLVLNYNYDVLKKTRYTNSEIMKRIKTTDFGNLYNNGLSILQIYLMLPENINAYLENNKEEVLEEIAGAEDNKKCVTYVVAKQYTTLKEVQDDNHKTIYFDKQFDKLPYPILDEFEKELTSKSIEEFYPFFVNKLIEKYKYSSDYAPTLAQYIISKAQPVVDGNYAQMYGTNELIYFIRKNNVWNLSKEKFEKNLENIDCNMKEQCITIQDKCESTTLNKKEIKKNMFNKAIEEFDKNYQISKAEMDKSLNYKFKYYESIMKKLNEIHNNRKNKYSLWQYNYGLIQDADAEPIIVSPYFKLRDLILGQSNFIKKQTDILDFTYKYCRNPIEDTKENMFWGYCIKTGAKLLPLLFTFLANAFINDPSTYIEKLNMVIKDYCEISDDGDCIVDKHSGYVIRKIDFDEEEGYDESGFKNSSRAVIEEIEGYMIKKPDTELSPEIKIISNIISAISGFMYININEINRESIIRIVTKSMTEHMIKRKEHEKLVVTNAKKGKKTPDYNIIYNSFVLYLTLGALLIGIQTSIPSLTTKKTHPGCVKSFQGFPFMGEGDDSAIQYIACIANKIKNSSNPWQILKKEKEETIVAKLKIYIKDYLITNMDVIERMKLKNEYLLTDESITDIPDEHNIDRWTQFLPPLKEFVIKPRILQDITKEFKDSLMRSLKTESFDEGQREKLMIIESKIIFFSLGIQEKIQKVVKNEILLMTNMAGVPFLENACCDENNKYGKTTIQYFVDKEKEIPLYNKIVQNLSNILEDINTLTKAVFLVSRQNTKKIFPPLSDTYEEITIYKTFINVCKFNSLIPLNPELLLLCQEKPKYLLQTDSITEKIAKMKQNGLIYTHEMFLQLLKIKDRENILSIPEFNLISPTQKLQNMLEYMEEHPTHIISPELIKLLGKVGSSKIVLPSLQKELTSEEEDLINYLMETNDAFKIKIYEFIISNSSLKKTEKIELKNNIENMCKQSSISFIKQYIYNFTTIFPNIILNKIDYTAFKMPKYFGLSQFHSNDIKVLVDSYYKSLRKYYNDDILTNMFLEIKNIGIQLKLFIGELPNQLLLFEHIFLNIFMEYIHLIDMPNILTRNRREDVDFTSESVEESDLKLYSEHDTSILLGSKKTLKIAVTNLMIDYLNIMSSQHEIVNLDSEDIMDIVFKIRQKEKDTFTDRLKSITIEEKTVDTMLKTYKIGQWSKGLQKGLTVYDKETYDEDRDEMEKLVNIENKLLKSKRTDMDMNDIMDEERVDNEIDEEDNDLSNLYGDGDDDEGYGDDGDGTGEGNEFENTGYIED